MAVKEYKLGMIGGGFMGKAHALAFTGFPMFFWPAPGIVIKKTIADATKELAEDSAKRYGFLESTDNWQDIIDDPEIDIVDICVPNSLHYPIAMAAAKAGKHIMCEKPLALTGEQAKEMYRASKEAGIITTVCFNYRQTPAVLLAKEIIDKGEIGKILDFHATYMNGTGMDPETPLTWRNIKSAAGSGALGDIASHVVDMMRFLVGEFTAVNGRIATYVKDRPVKTGVKERGTVDVDDQCSFMIECENGVFGTIESTRNALGRNNSICFEIHGTEGAIRFDYGRRDELEVSLMSDPEDRRGFRTICTGPLHPNGKYLWPTEGIGNGYTESKLTEAYNFINSISKNEQLCVGFKDGCQISLIEEAVQKSAETRQWERVEIIE